MIIGKFGKEGDGYRGSIFSRERCGRVTALRPIRVKHDGCPDFVVTSENADGNQFDEIGVAWEKISRKGKPYLLVKLNRPTFWYGAHCALVEQQDGTFSLLWKRTQLKAEEAAEAAA